MMKLVKPDLHGNHLQAFFGFRQNHHGHHTPVPGGAPDADLLDKLHCHCTAVATSQVQDNEILAEIGADFKLQGKLQGE